MANVEKLLMFLREWEGLSLKCYNDVDQVACGYGHRMTPLEIRNLFGSTISIEQAEEWLIKDAEKALQVVRHVEKIKNIKFNDNQLHALTSFIYNTGYSADYIADFFLILLRDIGRIDPFWVSLIKEYNQYSFIDKSVKYIHPLLFHFRLYIATRRGDSLKSLFNRRTAEAMLFANAIYDRIDDYSKIDLI